MGNAKRWNERLVDGIFALFVFSIPVSQRLSAGIIVVLVLLTPFSGRMRSLREGLRSGWDLILFFIVLTAGLIITTDQAQGLRVLETSLSLLGASLAIGFSSRHIGLKSMVFYPFSGGIALVGVYCLFHAAYAYYSGGGVEVFFYERFTSPVDTQPTYLAYYIIFAITCGLYLLFHGQSGKVWLTAGIVSFLFFLLLLTGGQTTFVGLQLVLAFFLLKYMLGERGGARTVTFVLALVMMTGVFVYTLVIRNEPEFTVLREQNDFWERWVLWESGFGAQQDIVFGVGTGDYNLVLNAYYRDHGLADFADRNTNAHNQYIQTLFMNGAIGMISLLVMLARPLYLFARRGIPLGILIMFPFVVYAITEVFLGRYQGVVFFGLLHQIAISFYYSGEPNFQRTTD